MKTKLAFLLALAIHSASAQSQNLNPKATCQGTASFTNPQNVQKPTLALPPSQNSSPLPRASKLNSHQDIIRILPGVLNGLRPPLQSIPPSSQNANNSHRSLADRKPSNHNAQLPQRKPAVVPRNHNRPTTSGLDLPNAAGIRARLEIADGLRSLDSLRHAGFQELRPDNFDIPAGTGNKSPQRPVFPDENQTFSPRTPCSPISPGGRGNGLTDIRRGMGSSRRGNATNGLSATGDRVYESEVSAAAGRSGTSTPSESTTHGNGDVTVSTDTTSPSGATTHVEVTEFSDGSGTTTTTHGNDGTVDTLTVTRRDATGRVIASRTDNVYPGGKQHVVTRDGSGRVTSDYTEYYTPGRRSGDRSPDEIANGGPVNGTGPSVADVTGLVPLDLLRQFANGENSSGGTNTMTNGSLSSRHVNPDRNGNSGTNRNRLRLDSFGTISNPAPAGGEGAVGGGNRHE